MDILDEELIKFWEFLNHNNVSYIMVGGFAVNLQGYTRATEDSDLWLMDSLGNRKNLRKAFRDMGYGDYASLETMPFVPGWTQFYIAKGLVLDIMTSMKGLENISFDECLSRARIADFNGVHVPFLSIDDLIANKKAVARPKDQIDVIELERIKKLMEDGRS